MELPQFSKKLNGAISSISGEKIDDPQKYKKSMEEFERRMKELGGTGCKLYGEMSEEEKEAVERCSPYNQLRNLKTPKKP